MSEPTHTVVTASFTVDGAVAWRRADGTWSRSLEEAGLWSQEAASSQREAARQEQRTVCDPYLVEVRCEGGRIKLLSMREKIRAKGPTITLPGSGG